MAVGQRRGPCRAYYADAVAACSCTRLVTQRVDEAPCMNRYGGLLQWSMQRYERLWQARELGGWEPDLDAQPSAVNAR
jgi:hypothetical protein